MVTAPAPVVTLAEAKPYLSVIGGHDDALITRLIASATAVLDGPTGILGRALGLQVWDGFLTNWRHGPIHIPMSPLVSVDAIGYRTNVGLAETILPAQDFSVFAVGDYHAPGYVTSPAGWPSLAATHADAVRIRFTAGWAAVPEPIKQAILVDVKIQYDKPTGDELRGLHDTYKRLISGFRKRRV